MLGRPKIANQRTSFHEAGHVYASWFVGLEIYKVQVRTFIAGRRGIYIKTRAGKIERSALGLSEVRYSLFDSRYKSVRECYDFSKELNAKRIFIAAAGPLAEEHFGGTPLTILMRQNIGDDAKNIKTHTRLAGFTIKQQDALFEQTKQLIHSPPGWRCISRLAHLLERRGNIPGDEAAAICRAYHGASPRQFHIP